MARKSPVSGRSGSVRIQRLSGVALSAAEAHAKRRDHNGKVRSVYDEAPITTTGLDLNDLYDKHIAEDIHLSGQVKFCKKTSSTR